MADNTASDPIVVHIYGKLRRQLPPQHAPGRHTCVRRVPARLGVTLGALLAGLEIQQEDLSTVFLNGSLLLTRNAMAPWLQYQQAQDDVWNWDLSARLSPGDRLGLFGEDMALLVV